jgi:pimeloyl-ACP methyl ester carboxylesterase
MSVPQRQVAIDGLLSSYTEIGEGQPFLLLHGWGCNADTFNDLQVELSKSFKVFAVSFPGFGGSDEPKSVWGCHEYADWTEKFIQKMNIQNPIVLGHSFGGRISLILNANVRISKLILTGCAGLITENKKASASKYIPKFLKKGIVKRFFIWLLGSEDYKNTSPSMREIFKKVVNEDLESYAKHVYVPTLLLWGENDKATPLEMGKKFLSLIIGSNLKVIKNSGHYAFLDQKDEFLDSVNEFID